MANNTLSDLNNHLFAQLERLNEENISDEDLSKETERAKAISSIAKNIIDNAKITIDALKFKYENNPSKEQMPAQIRVKNE